jgi:DNA-binding NarL/FixJ family response regulator
MTNILLIDDDHNEFKLFSTAIKHFHEPLRCIYAHSAENAYEILKNFQPYIIFIEMDMPNTDGIECIKNIAYIKKDLMPIIVLYSDNMSNSICRLAKDAGAANCFTKTGSGLNLINSLSPFLSTL